MLRLIRAFSLLLLLRRIQVFEAAVIEAAMRLSRTRALGMKFNESYQWDDVAVNGSSEHCTTSGLIQVESIECR